MADVSKNPAHFRVLETWLRSYKAEELFDTNGTLISELKELAPLGTRRMSANPHGNGGLIRKPLRMPDFRRYGVEVTKPATTEVENTKPLGMLLRDVMRDNMTNFRVFGPDENTSNKLDAIYQTSKKFWIAEYFPEDADGGNYRSTAG